MLATERCTLAQALTYDFNGNLESTSKGVALDAQWGGGSYSGEWYLNPPLQKTGVNQF
jgi:hypothetical protein